MSPALCGCFAKIPNPWIPDFPITKCNSNYPERKTREKKEYKTIKRASDYFKLLYDSLKGKTTSHRSQWLCDQAEENTTFINIY